MRNPCIGRVQQGGMKMRIHSLFTPVVCILLFVGFSSISYAVLPIVELSGEPVTGGSGNKVPLNGKTGDCTNVSGTYTISGGEVEANDGQSGDTIEITGAPEITADVANCEGDIIFWGTFTAGPSATTVNPAAPVIFERKGKGQMLRVASGAILSWAKVSGWADGDEIGTWQQKTVYCGTSSCFNFDYTKEEEWAPVSMQGDRELKAKVWFMLKAIGDKLKLITLHVKNSGGGTLKEDMYLGYEQGYSPAMEGSVGSDTIDEGRQKGQCRRQCKSDKDCKKNCNDMFKK